MNVLTTCSFAMQICLCTCVILCHWININIDIIFDTAKSWTLCIWLCSSLVSNWKLSPPMLFCHMFLQWIVDLFARKAPYYAIGCCYDHCLIGFYFYSLQSQIVQVSRTWDLKRQVWSVKGEIQFLSEMRSHADLYETCAKHCLLWKHVRNILMR